MRGGSFVFSLNINFVFFALPSPAADVSMDGAIKRDPSMAAVLDLNMLFFVYKLLIGLIHFYCFCPVVRCLLHNIS